MTSEQTTIGGNYGKNVVLDENAGKDPWFDAPRFVGGLGEGKSEFLEILEQNRPMLGEYRGMKEAKSSTKTMKRNYARFIDLGGNYFSIQTTSQLEGLLKLYNVGQKLQITYQGMKFVEEVSKECHQWSVTNITDIQ